MKNTQKRSCSSTAEESQIITIINRHIAECREQGRSIFEKLQTIEESIDIIARQMKRELTDNPQ